MGRSDVLSSAVCLLAQLASAASASTCPNAKRQVVGHTDLPPHRRPSCVSQPGLVKDAPAPAASMSFFIPPSTEDSRSISCTG